MNNIQKFKQKIKITIYIILLSVLVSSSIYCQKIRMKSHWNSQIALENPDKGWYHHFPDNHINKYIIKDDSHLLEFPGMDHIYIRLAWAYLEPEEGKFNWDVIDTIINKWTKKGMKISFRISCKETSVDRIEQQFATPKWVMESGAKGNYYIKGKIVDSDGPWEPLFDDSIFLEKLENFLKVFAERYDGKPWVRYIDIGSIGDWGEGHTWAGSKIDYSMQQKKIHIDLYLKYFKHTQLVISDDFVYSIKNPKNRVLLHNYVLEHGISYRDDSPLVDGYFKDGYSDTYTVRSPEYFKDVYRTMPTIFELEHYHKVKNQGNWTAEEGSSISKYAPGKTGADFFRGALNLIKATYIGYHGDAHEWLTDNPDLTVELLNKCGYWYFLHQVDLPELFISGKKNIIVMTWENKGVAPAYNKYKLKLYFTGPENFEIEVESENTNWMPSVSDGLYNEKYIINLPEDLPSGKYELRLKLFSNKDNQDVFIALDPSLLDKSNYYKIASVQIKNQNSN